MTIKKIAIALLLTGAGTNGFAQQDYKAAFVFAHSTRQMLC
jgi:hypothetical protein